MKQSNPQWKQALGDQIPPDLAAEIDIFENEILLRKQGKIDEKVFAETRLRRGAYGQRYDNGKRHDGVESRTLEYPNAELTKGPMTLWDAPGMQRIKIPFGGLNARQLEVLGELAEEYSDGIAHITTRQDVQLHFIHIDDTPALMRRLAAVGITTREACGNTVRNVTACPIAGVCRDEAFDVTEYAKECAYFLLGHPDTQDFGRKFKIAFSGCDTNPCALVRIHDLGCIARVREVDGKLERGFEVYVGGGLGTVPYVAKLFDEFLPVRELLPVSQAMARVFARLGEKKNRNTARLKFLVAKLGLDEFKRLVLEERATLEYDPRWDALEEAASVPAEEPLRPAELLQIAGAPSEFSAWRATNVYRQRQAGYSTVTIALPLGDITADQLRGLADIARKYINETVRTTVEQNLVLRWVAETDLPALYEELKALGLHAAGAGTIVDITSCPGTDTCKLGISSSRGLAGELRMRLAESSLAAEEAIRDLRIKVSGCFNSCGQHHISDLGFYGVSRNKGGVAAPHFQVVLGGQWTENAGSYGLAIGAVPSKRIPEAVTRITSRYLNERQDGESFQAFIRRIGKAECKKMIEDLGEIPPLALDPSFYSDWHDPRVYTLKDLGVGECAGEVISAIDFQLTACEREAFEAQLALEGGEVAKAARLAYEAMLHGAVALLGWRKHAHEGTPDSIVAEFRTHFHDTQLFFDPFAGGKFAHYFFRAHERRDEAQNEEQVHRLIEETQLFIEACHSCYLRLSAAPATA
ncbi:MAG: nitrite/sulfite reductase [Bryobacterales bacterium]|nr:nitrite/sulfite reductase [Bryobacterales bacterium]